MKQEEVKGLFALAGIPILKIKPLPDGYNYSPDNPYYFKTVPRCVWWFVKTPKGWIEIGWRRRVISIDWEDTQIKKIITTDDVTKGFTYVHAWSIEDALRYLKELANEF